MCQALHGRPATIAQRRARCTSKYVNAAVIAAKNCVPAPITGARQNAAR